ncbi:MAG: lyase domain protein repeat-containing protein [Myxococcales bacterium]|nr:lyase domain protein repeat-containing protein [Myxococcales bacterium]
MKLRLCLAAAALWVGCKRAPTPVPPPEVSEVRVTYKGADVEGAPALDLAKLTEVARAAVGSSSGLPVRLDGGVDAAHDPRQRRYRLRVQLEIGAAEDAVAKKGNMRALVEAKLAPIGGEPGALSFEQTALAERAYVPGKPGEPAWQTHAERAIKDCVGGVGARVKLAAGEVGAIVTAIDGSDEELRDEAIRLAAERRETAAVPALVKRLKSDDHALRDRSIGALAAIGDRRAVRPLTEVAKFNDLSDLPKVLDALATIGGDEARSYLEFVGSGHDSSEMRDLAKQALVHLERREAERHRDLGAAH